MRIGLSTAAFYGRLETEEAAVRVAQLGLPCCEVFLETYSEYSADFGSLVRRNLGQTQAVSIHSKTQHFEGDLLGQSARQRRDALDMLDRFLDAGQALGAKIYVYHGPANLRGNLPAFSRWQDRIAAAIARCRERGILFAWETVSWCWLNTPERVGEFLSLWPEMYFVLDVKQVLELGQDPLDYVKAMGGRLCHVHILDYDDAGRHALPGRGVHDFRALAGALNSVGYRGDIILEPYAYILTNDQILLHSIDWLRETFHAQ